MMDHVFHLYMAVQILLQLIFILELILMMDHVFIQAVPIQMQQITIQQLQLMMVRVPI